MIALFKPESNSRTQQVLALLAVLLVVGVVRYWEDGGWFDPDMTPVDEEAEAAMLQSVDAWDAAAPGSRRFVAERVASRTAGFRLVGVRRFRRAGVPRDVAVLVHVPTGLEFSLIPGGEFMMGAAGPRRYAEQPDVPQHRVVIPRPFLMCRTELTQSVYERVCGSNPSYFQSQDGPVESINWRDARAFCEQTGLRLPSEAEWEYACRAGTTTRFCSGDDDIDLVGVAWITASQESGSAETGRPSGEVAAPAVPSGPRRVGALDANALGLHDMHGNVAEWCEDSWHDNYVGAPTDGSAWIDENDRMQVTRGGAWDGPPAAAASACRVPAPTEYAAGSLGVRPAATVVMPMK